MSNVTKTPGIDTALPLSVTDRLVADFVQQDYLLTKEMPTADRISQMTFIPLGTVENALLNKEVIKYIEAKGIIVDQTSALSPRQLALVNVLLNLSDRRSDAKKLTECGVSPAEYQAWRSNPVFSKYMRDRAEGLLGEGVTDAHISLVENVRSGDLASIKYINEITGRYNPRTVNEINAGMMMIRMLEIIQKHLMKIPGGPEIMIAIGNDLEALGQSQEIKEIDA